MAGRMDEPSSQQSMDGWMDEPSTQQYFGGFILQRLPCKWPNQFHYFLGFLFLFV
jgi:hypothetical protein